jgi:phosphate ABC transporter permease protein PstC/phosphate ABC transporter permease subunit PstA
MAVTSGPPPAPRVSETPGPQWFPFNIPNFGDHVFRTLCLLAGLVVIALFAVLVVVLVIKSWVTLTGLGLDFFTDDVWNPVRSRQRFGALAFVYGTLMTSAIAMLIAVPLGIATAAFLSEIAPAWLRKVASFMVEMLAAIPSVVYGFWGMLVMAPRLQPLITWLGGPNTGGTCILSAGLVLAIMIIPYVTAVSYDVCRAVPQSQREAALALGATRWQMIRSAVLPYARPGILGACFLALGRAIGETMAVTMMIGNITQIAWSPLEAGDSIASVLANQYSEASYPAYVSALTELALVLLLVSIITNALARLLIWRVASGRAAARGASRVAESGPARAFSLARALLAWLLPLLVCAYVTHWLLSGIFRTPRYLPLGEVVYGQPLSPGLTNVVVLVALYALAFAAARGLLRLAFREFTRFAGAVNYLMTGGGKREFLIGGVALVVLAALGVALAQLVEDAGLRGRLLALLIGLAALTVLATFGALGLCMVLTVVPLFIILADLAIKGVGSLNWDFFTNLPAPSGEKGGGLVNALYGSALLVALASVFAIPVGLFSAIYLAENRKSRVGSAIRFIGELLGGVPSIVIGIYIYSLLVKPVFGHNSGWAGAFALGLMMIPVVMRASEESLKLVPESIRQASYALGASQWQTVLRVIVPAALPAIITGVFLAIARIAGETAPLLFTAGNSRFFPRGVNESMPSIPYFIFEYAKSPYDDEVRQAWAAALVLLVLVMLLNFGIRFLTGKRVVLASRAG